MIFCLSFLTGFMNLKFVYLPMFFRQSFYNCFYFTHSCLYLLGIIESFPEQEIFFIAFQVTNFLTALYSLRSASIIKYSIRFVNLLVSVFF